MCRGDIIYLKTSHGVTLISLWVKLHKGRIKQCQVVRPSDHLGGSRVIQVESIELLPDDLRLSVMRGPFLSNIPPVNVEVDPGEM